MCFGVHKYLEYTNVELSGCEDLAANIFCLFCLFVHSSAQFGNMKLLLFNKMCDMSGKNAHLPGCEKYPPVNINLYSLIADHIGFC